jgi:DNA-binding CsgD family transcriptional regulator
VRSPARRELSAREREVAILVATGRTNREIGQQLSISERTAETHVLNILNKLGLQRRGEIASWAVREGLAPDRRAPSEPPRTDLPGGDGPSRPIS